MSGTTHEKWWKWGTFIKATSALECSLIRLGGCQATKSRSFTAILHRIKDMMTFPLSELVAHTKRGTHPPSPQYISLYIPREKRRANPAHILRSHYPTRSSSSTAMLPVEAGNDATGSNNTRGKSRSCPTLSSRSGLDSHFPCNKALLHSFFFHFIQPLFLGYLSPPTSHVGERGQK